MKWQFASLHQFDAHCAHCGELSFLLFLHAHLRFVMCTFDCSYTCKSEYGKPVSDVPSVTHNDRHDWSICPLPKLRCFKLSLQWCSFNDRAAPDFLQTNGWDSGANGSNKCYRFSISYSPQSLYFLILERLDACAPLHLNTRSMPIDCCELSDLVLSIELLCS